MWGAHREVDSSKRTMLQCEIAQRTWEQQLVRDCQQEFEWGDRTRERERRPAPAGAGHTPSDAHANTELLELACRQSVQLSSPKLFTHGTEWAAYPVVSCTVTLKNLTRHFHALRNWRRMQRHPRNVRRLLLLQRTSCRRAPRAAADLWATSCQRQRHWATGRVG